MRQVLPHFKGDWNRLRNVPTSSTSLGVMINGGDIIILSPETRTNIPCFSHWAPKYAPTPVMDIIKEYQQEKQGRICLAINRTYNITETMPSGHHTNE